jgi:hypothetical protein
MTAHRLTVFEYLTTHEPGVIDLVEDPSTAFVGDVERAHEVAVAGGLTRDDGGRYPLLVWFAVFP